MVVKSVFDQLGDEITFKFPPEKIVSLVPSQTELMAEFGLEREVVGITKFCIHPSSWLKSKTIVGGTKNFKFDVINNLAPDLIIGNKEENYQEGIHKLRERYPVWMSDITTYDDALAMIDLVGALTSKNEEAKQINDQIDCAFRGLIKRKSASVLYMIWRKPWMAAGKQTFINSMLERMGLRNVLADHNRYPVLSDEIIHTYAPEFIFLSSEPYPFREENMRELKAIAPTSTIILVDGEMFSWYGSRLASAPHYFNALPLS